VRSSQHPPKRCEIAALFEFKKFEKQVGVTTGDAVRKRLGRAHAAFPDCFQAVCLRRESVGEALLVELEEVRCAADNDPVALVDAAARCGLRGLDPKQRSQLGGKRGLSLL
jgi:hypothetical protein